VETEQPSPGNVRPDGWRLKPSHAPLAFGDISALIVATSKDGCEAAQTSFEFEERRMPNDFGHQIQLPWARNMI
jgi:hypothetical protein